MKDLQAISLVIELTFLYVQLFILILINFFFCEFKHSRTYPGWGGLPDVENIYLAILSCGGQSVSVSSQAGNAAHTVQGGPGLGILQHTLVLQPQQLHTALQTKYNRRHELIIMYTR